MQVRVRTVLCAISAAVLLAGGVAGCRREGKPLPPPTPEQVKTGIEQSAARVRNDPNLTPKQKEQALRLLEGMKASTQQQQRSDDGK